LFEIGLAPLDGQSFFIGAPSAFRQGDRRNIDGDDFKASLGKVQGVSSYAAGQIQGSPPRQRPRFGFENLPQEIRRLLPALVLGMLMIPSLLFIERHGSNRHQWIKRPGRA
jgi:hypothetical protein